MTKHCDILNYIIFQPLGVCIYSFYTSFYNDIIDYLECSLDYYSLLADSRIVIYLSPDDLRIVLRSSKISLHGTN